MGVGETCMKIAVAGMWHLGCVTAACLAECGYEVLGYDEDKSCIASLQTFHAPIFEPGLDELISKHGRTQRLQFDCDTESLSQADIVWVTYDTPVDDNDIADVEIVFQQIKAFLPSLKEETLVLISSQLPVGSTSRLQQYCDKYHVNKHLRFAYSPENLRLGKAINIFMQPDRVVIGIRNENDRNRIEAFFKPITDKLVWMSIESAEMTKHALNSFLASSVVFINELATICEKVGADVNDVERGLKSEERIGSKAYLRAGAAIAGGTLARDVNFLVKLGQENNVKTPYFSALLATNAAHKKWSCQRLQSLLPDIKNKNIVALGLTYKAGTDTLRRSTAIEICHWLSEQGANITAFDPAINALPEELSQTISLRSSLEDALCDADAVLITTEHPDFTALTADTILRHMRQPIILDASGFLSKSIGTDKRVLYYSVGR